MALPYDIPLSYNPINIAALTQVLSRYEGIHHNQMIKDFETELQQVVEIPYAVAVNSGTSAIHLSLRILGVGPGDYVLAPTFTYVATVNPICYLGAQPVFIDSELDTWNMDPVLLEDAILDLKKKNKVPKAIVLVHTYGMPCKLDQIIKLAQSHRIPVVEDAAESMGSTFRNQQVGTFGDIGIYSFNNNKVLTTYGGGAIVTKSAELAQKARFFATQAREPLPYYEYNELGYNYAISPLCAAMGLSQIPGLNQRIEARRRAFQYYRTALAQLEVQFQPEIEGNYSNRWFTTLIFKDEATKHRVTSVLNGKSVETRPLWRPMHCQPVYKALGCYDNGVALAMFERGLCLPSGNDLTEQKLKKVIGVMGEGF